MSDLAATSVPPAAPAASTTEDKTTAIVAYITNIGFLIAIMMHGKAKTKFGAFHLRQMAGLCLCSLGAAIPFLGWFIVLPFLFVLWIIGFIGAINGQTKPVPVLGEMIQKWFGSAFD